MNKVKQDLDNMMGSDPRFTDDAKKQVLREIDKNGNLEAPYRRSFTRVRSLAVLVLLLSFAGLFLFLVINEEGNRESLQPAEPQDGQRIVETTGIETALEKVDFKVKLPQDFPCEVSGSSAQVSEIANGEKFEASYVNEETRQFMIFEVSNVDWELGSPDQEVELPDGTTGWYLDNGAVQRLAWEDGGLSYFLFMGADKGTEGPVYTAEELVSIAEKAWFRHWK